MEHNISNTQELSETSDATKQLNKLKSTWTLYYHLPQDNDWTISGYKKICDFLFVEDVIVVMNLITENILTKCCFFIMKSGVQPVWEDPKNRNGGSFSYRISNKYVFSTWKDLSYILTGETMSNNKDFVDNINGITLSPKKNFCVMKIWLKSCSFQNPSLITNEIKNLNASSALFKNHTPEF